MAKKKNPFAVGLGKHSATKRGKEELAEAGRKGGLAGGRARADKMTAKQRSDSARKAAEARWAKKKPAGLADTSTAAKTSSSKAKKKSNERAR